MHELRVAVICPMAIEREAVLTQLRRGGFLRIDDPRGRGVVLRGEGVQIELIQCGIGKAAVVAAVEGVASDSTPAALVILAGAAGGLVETPEVPRIARVVTETSEREHVPAQSWRPIDAPTSEDEGVVLVGVDRVVATPAHKRELARRTGAKIVDMESHAFAGACERLGLMWTVVRGVSDTPDETLPAIVVSWIEPGGNTRTWRAARDLALRPWLLPHVLKVMKRSNLVLPKVGARVAALAGEAAAIMAGHAQRGRDSAAHETAPITPMPLAADAHVRTVMLVGGTFDPPHRAHVEMARAARDGLSAEAWLVFVPAARSPHKDRGPIAGDEGRVAMLNAAIEGMEQAIVWTDEIDRAQWEASLHAAGTKGKGGGGGGASYFVETLRRARRELDERADGLGQAKPTLMFVIGVDQAERFHLWHDARGILELGEPVVLPRGKVTTPAELRDAMAGAKNSRSQAAWSDEECRWWGEKLAPMPVRDVCATSLRAALEAGTDPDTLADALNAKVAKVIKDHRLYLHAKESSR